MMEYFDTNIFVYAFCKNVDDEEQKVLSQNLLKDKILHKKLIISEIILYEFAFVCHKLKEDPINIQNNLEFLSKYLKPIENKIHIRVLDIFSKTLRYKDSFDIFHLAFSEYYNLKLITFDRGFKNLTNLTKNEIIIK